MHKKDNGLKKNGKNRFVTSVSDDLAEWLINEAQKSELSEAAFIRMTLSQAKQAQEAVPL